MFLDIGSRSQMARRYSGLILASLMILV
jgi:hypothetical protein